MRQNNQKFIELVVDVEDDDGNDKNSPERNRILPSIYSMIEKYRLSI